MHLTYFGMHKHYIKGIFTELWDPHQLNVAIKAGNKLFYDHCQKIGMGNITDLSHKYGHPGVKKYKKQLIARIMGKPVKPSKKPAPSSSAPGSHNTAKKIDKNLDKMDKKVEKWDKKVDKFFDKLVKKF